MPYDILASEEAINKTAAALTAKKYNVAVVDNKKAALMKLMEMIPAGSDVMTGGSVTLEEIGFTDLLKSGQSGWINWKDKIFTEQERGKQMELRKQSSSAGYYLASAHALTEDGTIIQGSASGSSRVIRGGGWGIDARYCRSADRSIDYPSIRGSYLGFRVVLAPRQP